ncbi:hypothetical protein CVT24_013234 [Panaeolus cyanescens]|uniref:Cytochrome P450 n=1 Tax=Panaeolus cyanescens TaxID=181874 RepID=A0A409WAK8_9AGAR|nr:hypothetical protein CVT24_013234 [Panaeolus cyanescens]
MNTKLFNEYSTWTTAGVVLVLTVLSSLILRNGSRKNDKVRDLGGFSVMTAWSFFTKRYDFVRNHFKSTSGGPFKFNVLHHRVFAVAGEKAREAFLNHRHIDMSEGYRILLGGIPDLEDINIERETDQTTQFIKRLLLLLRRDRISDTLPLLFDDVHRRMSDWGTQGTINPFREVYDLVFQMTVRMATCRELAEDKEAISTIAQSYWDIEKSATPAAILLPWLPIADRKKNEKATMALYTGIGKYVKMRREAATPSTDPIDILIANGDSDDKIIGVIISIVFAGVINTGINSCWNLLYLGAHPEWKKRVTDEYKTLLNNYAPTATGEPLHKRLATIPMSAWEDELPSMDLVIRETLRMIMSSSLIRRNIQEDIEFDGIKVKKGDFLLYSTADAHMDEKIYTNPEEYDPGRYLPGREEDKKEAFAFVGWGAGRHPCAGMKVAKLEIKLVMAIILLGYEYELVDGTGKYPKKLPVPDRNVSKWAAASHGRRK